LFPSMIQQLPDIIPNNTAIMKTQGIKYNIRLQNMSNFLLDSHSLAFLTPLYNWRPQSRNGR
jgi:hypothetical protein